MACTSVVLMATFNGRPFIDEQVCSIKSQTNEDWVLLVRDDGSSDGTQEYLSETARNDDRIVLHTSSGKRAGSPLSNYSLLVDEALKRFQYSRYFFFCDQDDSWLPQKLDAHITELMKADEDTPALAVSDLSLIGRKGRKIGESYWRATGFEPDAPLSIRSVDIASRNVFPGCAMAGNRALFELAHPLPSATIMHDWWIAVLAAAVGQVYTINEPLVRYRQHAHNHTGSTSISRESLRHFLEPGAGISELRRTFTQAAEAVARLKERRVGAGHGRELETYSALPKLPVYKRLSEARNMGLRRSNGVYRAVLLMRLAFQLPMIGTKSDT